MTGDLVLTGATGFVGMELLERYLERSDRRIVVLLRAEDDRAARERIQRTLTGLFGSRARDFEQRVDAVAADLTAPGLGLAPARRREICERAETIIHSAASVSFSLGLDESRAINVEGTRRMLELASCARAHGRLTRYAQVSTAYVAGTHSGRFRERDHDVGQGFRNAYEQSKFEAEELVRGSQLPTTILRPSIIVGDCRSGWTAAFNVLYWPLRAFARGLYQAVPADPKSPIDAVSIDYVADAIHAICDSGAGIGQTFHLTAGRDASCVSELVELASRYFDLPAPRLLGPEEFLASQAGASSLQRTALAQSAVYFPYFAIDTEFDDVEARRALEPSGIRVTPLASYFERLLDFATRCRWGKRPQTRADALAAVAR